MTKHWHKHCTVIAVLCISVLCKHSSLHRTEIWDQDIWSKIQEYLVQYSLNHMYFSKWKIYPRTTCYWKRFYVCMAKRVFPLVNMKPWSFINRQWSTLSRIWTQLTCQYQLRAQEWIVQKVEVLSQMVEIHDCMSWQDDVMSVSTRNWGIMHFQILAWLGFKTMISASWIVQSMPLWRSS